MSIIAWLFQSVIFFILCESLTKPIIGIVTPPCDKNVCGDSDGRLYFPASYVKWIESGGGRVVPLFTDTRGSELRTFLSQVNGVLIPGGNAPTDPSSSYEGFIHDMMSIMRNYSQTNMAQKRSIPLWGTCDGFENMLTAIAKSGEDILDSDYNANNVALNIQWNQATVHNSSLFSVRLSHNKLMSNYNDLVISLFASGNVSYNNHNKGSPSTKFLSDAYVSTNFSILGTGTDLNNKEFVTMYESYPELNLNWFGVQFHPEKISFEFNFTRIPHSLEAVIANMYLAQAFVEIVRDSNNNTMEDAQYTKMSINNYEPLYTNNDFEQIFEFY